MILYIIWSYYEGNYISNEKGIVMEFESRDKALKYLGFNYDEDMYIIEDIPKKT